jgi:hypothetical protein
VSLARRLWWLIVDKPKPWSAFAAVVAYMFLMLWLDQTEVWFWTAIPLYWAWVAVVWRLQSRAAASETVP